ncbi:hypothetical protein [Variovorax sp. OK605]|uniref:hypothetical protein n=1 Tax=Variovorax sp. OK605 TaxID=1855317 RepID=UPI001160C9E3|nr:hypothetical protein [Variovorax sp. OK605]
MNPSIKRRDFFILSSVAVGLIGVDGLAHALTQPAPSPPTLEDDVRGAALILVGTFDQFVFRGHSHKLVPMNEFNVDFDTDNGKGNRSLNGFLRIRRILKNAMPEQIKFSSVIRLQGPVPSNDYSAYLHKEWVVFANEGVIIRYGEERRRIFGTTRLPMPLADEEIIRRFIGDSAESAVR